MKYFFEILTRKGLPKWSSTACLAAFLLLALSIWAPAARAVTAHIYTSEYDTKPDIRDSIPLHGSCEKGFLETRQRATWYIELKRPNGSTSDHRLATSTDTAWLDNAKISPSVNVFGRPGDRIRFRFYCQGTSGTDTAHTPYLYLRKIGASVNQGDVTIPYNTSQMTLSGYAYDGAQGVAVYHGNHELERFEAPANSARFSGILDISDVPIGGSWNLDMWAYASLPTGMHWRKIKTIKITKQHIPPPPPKPTLISPANGSWHNPSSEVVVTGKTTHYAIGALVRWERVTEPTLQRIWEIPVTPDGNGHVDIALIESAQWSDGEYRFSFATQREGGHYGEYTEWRTIYVDRTAPTVSWEGSPADGAIVKDLVIKGKVADTGSGPARAELQLKAGDGAWQAPVSAALNSDGSFSHNFNVSAEGAYQVRLRGIDKVDNVSAWSETRTFVVDRTAPVITIASPSDNSWYDGERLRVIGRIEDPVSGVGKVWLGSWHAGQGSYYQWHEVSLSADGVLDATLTGLGGKDLQIAVGAEDGVGNIGYVPGPYSTSTGLHVKVDTDAPTVAWRSGLATGQTTWFKSTRVTLGGTGTDSKSGVASGQYRWRNTAVAGAAWTESAALAAGADGAFAGTLSLLEQDAAYEVQLRATDRAGNVSAWSGSAFVKVKTTVPVVAWADSNAIEPGSDRITVRGRLSDASPTLANVKIGWGRVIDPWQYVSVKAGADGSFSHTFTGLVPGTHYEFKLLATDAAGNAAQPTERRRAWTWQAASEVFDQFTLSPEAHQDVDGSGGFTPGDKLVYRLRFVAGVDIKNFQVSLTLPEGVATDRNPGSRVQINPATRIDTSHGYLITHRLNQSWQGTSGDAALLVKKDGYGSPDLKKGDVVVLDIPVVLLDTAKGTLSAQARAWSGSNPAIVGEESGSVDVVMQAGGFPVAKALSASMATEGLPDGLTPLGTPFTYVVTLAAEHWPMRGAQLNYVLPRGLHRNGAPSFDSQSHLQQGLNADWEGTPAKANLLGGTAALAAGQRAVLRVPVKLDGNEVGDLCSEIQAGAATVSGNLWLGHRIDVELVDEDLSIHCPKPH
ncbi:fibronectin type III domain-containing protein [Pandoraea sp.]|uniref:fibronectin type III domain-containing protein n=1 Tax=Pandoraea sp. TaxID=1883445 RepID=UPI001210220F|nr:fibronectin type III domain-containing protein [Pandoraea sp.]TAL53376.1 MAG: hypothetical protein EPN80_15730 [Pandoraea sp.]TAM20466.1 MAG: hypothetical protein EPN65_00980 [Pandoraea sp.]